MRNNFSASKKNIPKISIGIPVYNGIDTIENTLKSVTRQTFKAFEVLISDDNSTDGTGKICRKFCQKDLRFYYVRQKSNLGWPGNLEFVFKNTRAPYFVCLSHDDYYKNKNYLEKLYQHAKEGYDFVYPDVVKITRMKDNKVIEIVRKHGDFDNSRSRFEKHLILLKNFYLGYQIFGLMNREKIANCFSLLTKNVFYRKSSKNYLDEEPFLHFVFSRYNTYFEKDVFYVKEMTGSNYFKLSVLESMFPLFWNTISVIGVIAQSEYTNWQKFQLIFFKILRSGYVLFDLCLKDIKRVL